jgi:hypothetical protein
MTVRESLHKSHAVATLVDRRSIDDPGTDPGAP